MLSFQTLDYKRTVSMENRGKRFLEKMMKIKLKSILDDGQSDITNQLLESLLSPATPLSPLATFRTPAAKTKTTSAFPEGFCLPDLLVEQANSQPDALAVVCCKDSCLTFKELVESSGYVASYLRHLGVVGDTCVGIFMEPSLDLMLGVWGTLFSGGAYLPLSPEYPEERLRYMMEHAKIKVVFSQESLRQQLTDLAPAGIQIVTLKDVKDFTTSPEAVNQTPFVEIDQDNLAYIIYTSGSTGKPKGVMIEHRAIVNQMKYMKEECFVDKTKTVIQKTPMSFDAAQWEILAPACGAKVVMGHPGIYRDVKGLIETIVQHRVTTLQCVPTLLQGLLDNDDITKCESLIQIFSGGEALSRGLAQQCLKMLPQSELTNLYGPTECTINASAHMVDRTKLNDGPHSISIGTPVSNTDFYVLNGDLIPVQPGELGELYIGGTQLARGYLHQPEMTMERFINVPIGPAGSNVRLYHTGDVACCNENGTYHYTGRVDNQVKLRGFRIELDEIRVLIERHDWVKNTAVLISNNSGVNSEHLIAYIELSPKEAVLMDQGNVGSQHQSKESRLQVRAQLAGLGCRDNKSIEGKPIIELSCKTATKEQREVVFGRKTYRFYEGSPVSKSEIEKLLGSTSKATFSSRSVETMTLNELGQIFRYFGQFISEERLLPKYGYASPGALYPTQMYLEIGGTPELESGFYYYHPAQHQLIQISKNTEAAAGMIKIHFVGKTQAIEPVYKNNIREVLEFETGHMLGLFDNVLPSFGFSIGTDQYNPEVISKLECADDDCYLATFDLVPHSEQGLDKSIDVYIQAHGEKVADLPEGQYRYENGNLNWIAKDLIQKNHVIAINQAVYERASFGVSIIRNTDDWLSYIALGRKLQQLQMNDQYFGFMSSGYSSKTGNDLPAAKRITDILRKCNLGSGPCYFSIGGHVTKEQWESEGMKEDTVHMKGPAEMIKEDLASMLPKYMVPKKVIVMDKLPHTANGKIDNNALKTILKQKVALLSDRPFIPPRTCTEEKISEIWKKLMKLESISIKDDFFESGGNSLIAVSMVHQLNKDFNKSLPLQTIFEAPTIEKLSNLIDNRNPCISSRLVSLHTDRTGQHQPIYMWPGLGGYPMNLRFLASQVSLDRSFYGIQAHGINENEVPYQTIKEMAARDIEQIKCIQPMGPYTLWGYSFGARVAFETAYQLEQTGDIVEHLFLIAPGSPKVQGDLESMCTQEPTFDNRAFITILFSIFAGRITGPILDECLSSIQDEESFVQFIASKFPHLQLDLIRRIVNIVHQTYEFKYTFSELAERCLHAPITIFKACGDDYSFLEDSREFSERIPVIIDMQADHYSLLKNPGVKELIQLIHERLDAGIENMASEIIKVGVSNLCSDARHI